LWTGQKRFIPFISMNSRTRSTVSAAIVESDGPRRANGRKVEDDVGKVGERLKRVRLERGLTLRKLAEAAGVAPGTIQKIEAGRLVPSIEVFVKVAKALRIRASEILGELDEPAEVRIIRNAEAKSLITDSRMRIQNIAEALREPRMEAYLARIPPGVRSGRPLGFSGEILFIGKKGSVDFWVCGKKEVINEGDTLHLKAYVPHRFENRNQTDAELLAIWCAA
jgi:transcriptional regulator with XRE-family HTH domain